MISVSQLGYIGLGVSRLPEWEEFVTNVLGLQIFDRSSNGTVYCRMDERMYRLALHPGGNDDLAYVGWEVADDESLSIISKRLRDAGIKVTDGTQGHLDDRRVFGLIHFQDPDGLQNEIYFGPKVIYNEKFRSSRPLSGFTTGSLGVGHVVINSSNMEQSAKFYRSMLGLRISDYVVPKMPDQTKIQIAFLRCNLRHHSIAVAQLGSGKRLLHFMLEVNSLDDVGRTHDLCSELGIPIARTLGRHSNDHMISFYLVSPSGFHVEYGWGARTIDDATWQVEVQDTGTMWGLVWQKL